MAKERAGFCSGTVSCPVFTGVDVSEGRESTSVNAANPDAVTIERGELSDEKAQIRPAVLQFTHVG